MTTGITWGLVDGFAKGTSLKGTVFTTYDKLVETFGEPNIEPGDKVWNEWGIEFEVQEGDDCDWITATVYDWKELHQGDATVGEYQWHIGGHNYRAVELVYEALGK